MLGILGLNNDLLALIASFLSTASAGRFANCIRDGAARAAVQGSPARAYPFRDVFWCRPQAPLPFRWWARAALFVDGDEQFLSVWYQVVEHCARRGGGAPWLMMIFQNCAALRNWHLVFLGPVCVSLELRHCWYISDVGPLGQVPKLEVAGCPLVNDIEGLGGRCQTWVSLERLPITSAWPVRLVPRVSIVSCRQLRDLEGFGEEPGQMLTLEDLPLKDFSAEVLKRRMRICHWIEDR